MTLVALNSPSPFLRPFSPFKLGSHRSDKIDAQDGARHKYSNKSSRATETRQEVQFIRSRKLNFDPRQMKMRKRSRNIILRRGRDISINCKSIEESEKI